MAGIKITDLPAAPSASLTDVYPVDIGSVTYKESNSQLLTLFQANMVSTITGTANQVIASSGIGNVTLSLPQSIATSSNVTFGSITSTNDATIHGLTVGIGSGSISTNTVLSSGGYAAGSTGNNNVVIGYRAGIAITSSG